MSGPAVLMLLLATVVLLGGLVAALVNLQRSPDLPSQEEVHRDL